jgi:hypothetical protein
VNHCLSLDSVGYAPALGSEGGPATLLGGAPVDKDARLDYVTKIGLAFLGAKTLPIE